MKKELAWWQLSLLGIACIVGTGFFLGSALAIQKAGPSALVAYVIAGVGTLIVFDALAKLTAHHPEKGSFRTYAKQAFGDWAGFSVGWVYWICEMLIMGSQLTALAIFTRFWFPEWPIWMIASIFALLGIIVILTGLSGFERIENIFAIMKLAAIFIFILLASLFLFGLIGNTERNLSEHVMESFFEKGTVGIWIALLYAYYSFGGIEVMGLLATNLKEPKDTSKSGTFMLTLLTVLYTSSLYFIMTITSWKTIKTEESPFITALKSLKIPFMPDIFNGVLIIAGFSTFVASLYAIMTVLVTLSEDGDAPKRLSKKGKRNIPYYALFVMIIGVFLSILLSFLLPKNIFEYMASAAGLMLLYTWIIILLTYQKLLGSTFAEKSKSLLGGLFLLIAIIGSLFEKSMRMSFFVSIAFLIVVVIVTWIKEKKAHVTKLPNR